MSVNLDLTLSPTAMIYKLLTESTTKLPNGFTLSAADLTFSAVSVATGRPDNHNTGITITPVASSTAVFGDAKEVFYTRKALADVATAQGMSLAVTGDLNDWTEANAPATALGLLKTGIQSFLTAEDIVVSTPVTNGDGTVSTVVTMAAAHLTLIGAVTFVATAAETRLNTSEIPESQPGLS